jgi:ketosteroid isomerase-like protein
MATCYETPQNAENAFYDAFEGASTQAMREAWDENPDLVCIHPGAPMLRGWEAIAKSWERIFAAPRRISITVHHREWIENGDLAIHILEEQITSEGAHTGSSATIPVTNAYRRGREGWHMILHHASPPPIDPGERSNMAKSTPRPAVH